jgi:hypothetical protein
MQFILQDFSSWNDKLRCEGRLQRLIFYTELIMKLALIRVFELQNHREACHLSGYNPEHHLILGTKGMIPL